MAFLLIPAARIALVAGRIGAGAGRAAAGIGRAGGAVARGGRAAGARTGQQIARIRQANARMPQNVQNAIKRKRRKQAVDYTILKLKIAATRERRQAALMRPTIRAEGRGFVAGGSRRVGRHRVAAGILYPGSEYGSTYFAFKRPNSAGYWFHPTLRRARPHGQDLLSGAADDAIEQWGRGDANSGFSVGGRF